MNRWPLRMILGLAVWLPAAAAVAEWQPPMPVGCPARPTDADQARALAGDFFRQATAAGEARDYPAAAELYACSIRLQSHPNSLYNFAVVAAQAERLRDAAAALERFLEEAPNALNRAEAETLLADLRTRIAAAPTVEPPPGPGVVPPGGTTDPPGGTTDPPGGNTVPPGGTTDPPGGGGDEEGVSGWSIAGWTLAGAGVAVAGIAGTAFAVLAADAKDRVENSPEDTPWSAVASYQVDFENYTAAEIACFAVGGAALVAGAVVLLLDLGGNEAPSADAAPVEGVLVPGPVAGGVGLVAAGRF